ncbi:hypothetical protein SBE55_10375 [Mycolicibacterium sp. 141076]|uniref:hypothetical protein n=1 Tax=Mycolicibacterium sp. 141076 TaxID=3090599 RepID=UPI00299E6F6A|nr:hypothetical protein [Mycolicibacterium sp. 141076]MDX1878223.1 hypothetical protein [Mycolicibacterium sp. 141076]
MIIPTTKSNPTREDFVRGWMEHFGNSREEAEKKTQLYINLGLFKPSDAPDTKPAVTPEQFAKHFW